MSVYIMLANGFEEAEALVPADILRRAGVEVYLTAIDNNTLITGSHGIRIITDTTIDKVNFASLEAVILPGGAKGTEILYNSEETKSLINKCAAEGKYIGAICAAPSILSRMGLLSGRRTVCHPTFEKYLEGSTLTSNLVEHDDIFITAKAVGASFEFGLQLVRVIVGNDVATRIAKEMYYCEK